MADTQSYSYTDIQRYLQQKMSAQEMYAFEKALMDDPFLADAIEGYSASDEVLAEKHLATIEDEIAGNKEKAKVVPLPAKKTAWWKAAAIVLVVATGGALSYSLFNKNDVKENSSKEIAVTKPAESAIRQDSIGPVEKPLAKTKPLPEKEIFEKRKANSISLGSSPLAKPQRPEGKTAEMSMLKEQHQAADAMANKTEVRPAMAAARSAAPVADSELQEKSMALAAEPLKNQLKGRVIDETGQPIAGAAIVVKGTTNGASADNNGEFFIGVPGKGSVLVISAVGIPSTEVTVGNKKELLVTLTRSSQNLSEVVVTALGKRRKSNYGYLKGDTIAGAVPAGGWNNFNQYINEQVDSLKSVVDNEFENQSIELEFSLDKEGRPTDIQARKNEDKVLADKVKQMLMNGPKWKNEKKGKKVKVIISF